MMIVEYDLNLKTDPEQELTHLVLSAADGTKEGTACGTELAVLEDAELPITIGLLCPGCFLIFTRTLAAHYRLPLTSRGVN